MCLCLNYGRWHLLLDTVQLALTMYCHGNDNNLLLLDIAGGLNRLEILKTFFLSAITEKKSLTFNNDRQTNSMNYCLCFILSHINQNI